jgi:serine/threonine-protein kinase ATR
LNLRRVLLGLADPSQANKNIGRCWLQSAKIARESGLLQTAHSSLLSADQFQIAELSIEKAKWFWDRVSLLCGEFDIYTSFFFKQGDHDQAQSCLEGALQEHFPNREKLRMAGNETEERMTQRIQCAKVNLFQNLATLTSHY